MELFLPLPCDLLDLSNIKTFHEKREFVAFSEDLFMVINYNKSKHKFKELTVSINDALVFRSTDQDIWISISDNLFYLKKDIVREHIFGTHMVMNNGHQNRFEIVIYYEIIVLTGSSVNKVEDVDYILPSFEPVTPYVTPSLSEQHNNLFERINLNYPIYSLLNIRLRHISLRTKKVLLSSLDLQVSKALLKLLKDPEILIKSANYRLIDELSKIDIESISKVNFPLPLKVYDSYSINYELPQTIEQPHRVCMTIQYQLLGSYVFDITTSWETNILDKRIQYQMHPSPIKRVLSHNSVPFSSQFNYKYQSQNSSTTSSLVQYKLSNVNFKFLNNSIITQQGEMFTINLQINNFSKHDLNLVAYYSQTSDYLTKKKMVTVDGIILLSNDYRIPIISPGETYEIELECIGIIKGYYCSLNGLKVVDLDTKEVIEINQEISVLIQ